MLINEDLTYQIRAAIFAVSNELGSGYLEKVYENALAIELSQMGLQVSTQTPLQVNYKGQIVGDFVVDILVNDQILLELKAIKSLNAEHEAQIINYLKATGIKVGLLVNFGQPKAQIKRFVL